MKNNRSVSAREWNVKHDIGTPVRYYPVLPGNRHRDTHTCSVAWELYDGTPVVMIENHSGGVALSHLRVLGCKACGGTGVHMAPYMMGLKDGDVFSMSECSACSGTGKAKRR